MNVYIYKTLYIYNSMYKILGHKRLYPSKYMRVKIEANIVDNIVLLIFLLK